MESSYILVVDGDPEARSEIAQLFTERGYVTKATGSASEAVAFLEQTPFRCAIVDVELTDVPGLDAIALLRRTDPALRFVVTAGKNTKELETEVRRHDVVYYYVKSFDREELLQAVARAIGGGPHLRTAGILVVDEDRAYQFAIRGILASAGYEVTSAYTRQEGLAALTRTAPDLVILDITMARNTDGLQFLRDMNARAPGEMPPVLSVSVGAKPTDELSAPTTEHGWFPVDDFLSKPVDPRELLSHVEALLGGCRPPRPREAS
jgi:CheY-like chemotaxis protein